MQLPTEQKQTIWKNFDNGKLSPQEIREYLPLILARARDEGRAVIVPFTIDDRKKSRSGNSSMVFYSRPSINEQLPADERFKKAIDYFVLLRDPLPNSAITGENLRADVDDFNQAVNFTHDSIRGRLFGKLTEANQPSSYNDGASWYYRYLAIILDGKVVSAPYLSSVITDSGQIEMKNSPRDDRVRLVKTLRAGALPAPLKPIPVSQSTIGSTLGGDTIYKGLMSVAIAFAAVMVFMMIYYQFAGIVACTALLVNLVLTVAFMVFVNATFTLPGLAGLVLMLGMAVDANVLIYERIREERDRGASLSLAIRNGYDRAFPTIVDTHLTSFFTAIVLYAVGNDQLRGFGISLASGLVISMFTALYMTRLIFDIWQYKGWLKKLSMFRFFTKTNIDFMAIRNYMFATTVALTVFGLALFLLRGEQGRNIDFVGGTAFGGQLDKSTDIGTLRKYLKNQEQRLAVASVQQVDDAGRSFRVTFKNFADKSPQIEFVEPVLGPNATKQAREEEVKKRASQLPDWSVEQIFVSGDAEAKPGQSRFFTVRSTEKESDLVQVAVSRLLAEEKDGKLDSLLKSSELDKYDVKGRIVTLEFKEGASPAYLKSFLERQFKQNGFGEQAFDLRGEGRSDNNRFKTMVLEITTANFDPVRDRAKLDQILQQTLNDFADRPQPERLEKFDAQLAAETSGRALYAIFASWLAILLYLWFRCGSWTFGIAAVLCLIHDLCFTLGAIAFCHYLVEWAPGLASALLIDDFKIDLPAVAALLTLVGFSVNDTIVVFDRIREVRGKNPELTVKMINESINQTLSRTLLASTTVFLVVGVLYVFGGESIRLFAFVMVVGVIVGTYSSIYVASPLLIMLGEGQQSSRGKGQSTEKTAIAQS
jgi:SecD/SecF fusion protein